MDTLIRGSVNTLTKSCRLAGLKLQTCDTHGAFCAFCASLQRSTECTSIAGHSSQHNITQHGMLPQYPTDTEKLM